MVFDRVELVVENVVEVLVDGGVVGVEGLVDGGKGIGGVFYLE